MPRFEGGTLRAVFDELKQSESVLFSFNSNLLDLDRMVDVAPYQGIMIKYLEDLLGEKYSFKETSTHIIITYAPQRLDVHKLAMDTMKNNRTRITGYVMDIQSNKPLNFVTVYDGTTFQAAALSRKNGYFELDLKNLDNAISLSLSKENYRDTTLMLLLPVDISDKVQGRKVGYYPMPDSAKTIANSAVGRFFTSSRQRIQSLNIGGFFVYSPFQISMTPGLSTHGLFNSHVVNKVSLNMIGGYTAGVAGVELAGVFNVNQFAMRGLQLAGVTNIVGGDIFGFQAAGIGNMGLNNVTGIQMAGVWNSVDTILAGAQLAGVANIAADGKGNTQLSGVFNVSGADVGSQVATVLNKAKKVHGIQLGIVNIADSSAYPIGLFNWISTGHRQLSVSVDEKKFTSLTFRSGGRVMYAVLGAGIYLGDQTEKYGMEAGLGTYLLRKRKLSLSVEIVQRMEFKEDWVYKEANRTSLRLIPALNVSKQLQLYVAPSLTYAESVNRGSKNVIQAGGMVGVAYGF